MMMHRRSFFTVMLTLILATHGMRAQEQEPPSLAPLEQIHFSICHTFQLTFNPDGSAHLDYGSTDRVSTPRGAFELEDVWARMLPFFVEGAPGLAQGSARRVGETAHVPTMVADPRPVRQLMSEVLRKVPSQGQRFNSLMQEHPILGLPYTPLPEKECAIAQPAPVPPLQEAGAPPEHITLFEELGMWWVTFHADGSALVALAQSPGSLARTTSGVVPLKEVWQILHPLVVPEGTLHKRLPPPGRPNVHTLRITPVPPIYRVKVKHAGKAATFIEMRRDAPEARTLMARVLAAAASPQAEVFNRAMKEVASFAGQPAPAAVAVMPVPAKPPQPLATVAAPPEAALRWLWLQVDGGGWTALFRTDGSASLFFGHDIVDTPPGVFNLEEISRMAQSHCTNHKPPHRRLVVTTVREGDPIAQSRQAHLARPVRDLFRDVLAHASTAHPERLRRLLIEHPILDLPYLPVTDSSAAAATSPIMATTEAPLQWLVLQTRNGHVLECPQGGPTRLTHLSYREDVSPGQFPPLEVWNSIRPHLEERTPDWQVAVTTRRAGTALPQTQYLRDMEPALEWLRRAQTAAEHRFPPVTAAELHAERNDLLIITRDGWHLDLSSEGAAGLSHSTEPYRGFTPPGLFDAKQLLQALRPQMVDRLDDWQVAVIVQRRGDDKGAYTQYLRDTAPVRELCRQVLERLAVRATGRFVGNRRRFNECLKDHPILGLPYSPVQMVEQ